MEIVEIINSPKQDKRFRVAVNMGGKIKNFDFGSAVGQTYIDHGDKVKRNNYLLRHTANATERKRITELIPSPAMFSAWLLWGDSTDLFDNIVELNKHLKHL